MSENKAIFSAATNFWKLHLFLKYILEKNSAQVYAFIETCLFETSCLLILSSCKEQILNGSNIDNEEFSLLTSNESNNSSNKITLESIGEIVVLIKYFICKSNSLFEKVFAFFIDILINEINVNMNNGDIINQRLVSIISGHVVELLKCFDLTRASFMIKHFLEVNICLE